MSSLVQAHADASRLLESVVAGVAADDLTRETPCAGWTVADLLAHLGGHERGWAVACSGARTDVDLWAPLDEGTQTQKRIVDLLTETREVVAGHPEVELGEVWVPVLVTTHPLPGSVALRAHLLDMATHAWDVAVAVRRSLEVPAEVAAIALEVAEGIPDGPDRSAPDSFFAPRLSADGTSAASFERVLALLGRDPAWRSARV